MQSPTDVDAEESSFESQFNGLADTSGVTLTQFSGFAPATTHQLPATSATGTPAAKSGVVAVPTTLTVTGDYAKMTAFINGLDSFPRLFVIQTFDLAYGAGSSNSNAERPPHRPPRRSPSDVTSSAPASVGGWNADRADGRSVQSVHHGVDLLHLDPQRPGRLHQSRRLSQLERLLRRHSNRATGAGHLMLIRSR